MSETSPERPYHHGQLGPALRANARAILEEEGLAGLSLRSVARRAGVSHTAPYRHYASREALLADIACEGIAELRAELAQAAAAPADKSERIVRFATVYLRFAARHPGLIRLIFGAEFRNRSSFSELTEATNSFVAEIGQALADPAAGVAGLAAMHGLAMLILDNVIDLGQQQSGWDVVPSRAGILLRSLLESSAD
ncbi:MAG TPA: TetR/AcrR family transcriptional regulator [Micropepsaceae bacterium]|nr:TetR/AcrR family transcriptional regulator [Micropepsaceae bacterium]